MNIQIWADLSSQPRDLIQSWALGEPIQSWAADKVNTSVFSWLDSAENEPSNVCYKGLTPHNCNAWIPQSQPSTATVRYEQLACTPATRYDFRLRQLSHLACGRRVRKIGKVRRKAIVLRPRRGVHRARRQHRRRQGSSPGIETIPK